MPQDTLKLMTWLIPAGPFLAFLVISLFTNRNRTLSWVLAWCGVIASLIIGWAVAFNMFGTFLADGHELALHPVHIASSVDWIPVGACVQAGSDCASWINMGVAVDALTAVMLIMVPLAVFMIFVYSVGYHNYGNPRGTQPGTPNHGKEEPMFSRFFAYMSLFAGAMLLLVVTDNLLGLFIGWEIMGFCSYSLIGFWYAREYHLTEDHIPHIPPYQAAKKAFMTTRVADVVMLLGIVFFYRQFGTLNFSQAFTADSLAGAIAAVGPVAIGVMALLLFTGTVGKSAQWPLHVWLPDAMEGPTPVSATIHAAAMVSAGVYLLLRIFPLIAVAIHGAPAAGWIIAFIGAFTALMAATIAVAQNDVKGVLAYSTISQLGFMVAAVGIGAYIAAAFHLITHAFFKALLFLASGSVIHGMEHGADHVHDHHTDPQDMRYMGGLRHKMPITFWTFVIGGMALSGLPIVTAGFWSKDEIFADAWLVFTQGDLKGLFVFVVLGLAALLTAFYTARQLSMTFLGEPRSPLAEHAHESNGFMTVPLMVLAVFALSVGWFGIPEDFPVLGPAVNNNFFHHFVGTSIEETISELYTYGAEPAGEEAVSESEVAAGEHTAESGHGGVLVGHELEAPPVSAVPLATSVVVAVGGLFLGWWIYGYKPLKEGETDPLIPALGPLHRFLQNKWYWDELYHVVFYKPTIWVSEVVVPAFIDKGIIDSILHIIARTVYGIGYYVKRFEEIVIGGGVDWVKDQFLGIAREVRQLQSGKIQEYVAYSGLFAAALAFIVIVLVNNGWYQRILDWIQQTF